MCRICSVVSSVRAFLSGKVLANKNSPSGSRGRSYVNNIPAFMSSTSQRLDSGLAEIDISDAGHVYVALFFPDGYSGSINFRDAEQLMAFTGSLMAAGKMAELSRGKYPPRRRR